MKRMIYRFNLTNMTNKEVLRHLNAVLTVNDGLLPSFSELAKELGLTRQAYHFHLTALTEDGFISRPFPGTNSVRITKRGKKYLQ